MRWEQGRATIDAMIATGRLQQVPPSRDRADTLLTQARRHLATSTDADESDPEGAYALLYDAARKALTAVLENQGLRVTSHGGHVAVFDAVLAQLDPPLGRDLRSFQRLRRRRNAQEYPGSDEPALTAADLAEDRAAASALVNLADRVLDQMSPY